MLERGTRMGKGAACVGNSRAYLITRRKCIFEENTFPVSSCLGRKRKDPLSSWMPQAEGKGWGDCVAFWVKMKFVSV